MRFSQLSSTLGFLFCCGLSAVLAGDFVFHNSPGYGMTQLPSTLKRVLQSSPHLPSTYPQAMIEEVRVSLHHPLQRQLSGIFKSIPADEPRLINLGPLEPNGERNTAFAVPIEHDSIRHERDERLFALFSAHKAKSGATGANKIDLHSLGFVKAKFVGDIEKDLQNAEDAAEDIRTGEVLSPDELLEYISEAH
ncbi:uncharacterized protein UTRI_06254 [Ustilago trichophora]|uniref:Uncharacterized protein n=1 Tax=Ustilago trichophora TaxID=86804 RepID=A0A5C3EGV3_9BASI|nr:uncharacterized protein UTRI_06254 [Ustilago trichophora]